MREIRINKNDAGQRLDKYLSKRFKTMPKSLMYKYLRTKYIKLNGKKVQPDVFLNEGDVLTLYIRDEFFDIKKDYDFLKSGKELSIVYEDENIILIDKKVGVICTLESREEYPEGDVRCVGSRADEATIARHLYEILRDFDADGVDLIYTESLETPELGEAVMNRLIKAAGHKIIQV